MGARVGRVAPKTGHVALAKSHKEFQIFTEKLADSVTVSTAQVTCIKLLAVRK